jgi:mRNA interferase RelE/StbE
LQKQKTTEWQLKFSPLALKDLKKLDKGTNKVILAYLYEKLETEDDPKRFGKPLAGNLKEFWRYRVGDYRIICEIKNHEFQILAVHVAHRRKVYQNIHLVKSPA